MLPWLSPSVVVSASPFPNLVSLYPCWSLSSSHQFHFLIHSHLGLWFWHDLRSTHTFVSFDALRTPEPEGDITCKYVFGHTLKAWRSIEPDIIPFLSSTVLPLLVVFSFVLAVPSHSLSLLFPYSTRSLWPGRDIIFPFSTIPHFLHFLLYQIISASSVLPITFSKLIIFL